MDNLTKLLYRKNILEHTLTKTSKAIEVYNGLIKAIDDVLSSDNITDYDRHKIEAQRIDAELKGMSYSVNYKNAIREYKNYIIPKISEEIENNDAEELKDLSVYEDESKRLAELEIYGKADVMPDNVEHIEIIEDFKRQIKNCEDIISACESELKSSKSPLEKAEINKTLFENQLQIINLKKRLSERTEYYYKSFKPRFDRDMSECDERLDLYLDIARKVVKMNIDIRLGYLLQEYEKHKDDEEKLWGFYTALKTRLKKIAKHMRKNKHLYKGKMDIAKKELYEDKAYETENK